jgi:hypothetical protein
VARENLAKSTSRSQNNKDLAKKRMDRVPILGMHVVETKRQMLGEDKARTRQTAEDIVPPHLRFLPLGLLS